MAIRHWLFKDDNWHEIDNPFLACLQPDENFDELFTDDFDAIVARAGYEYGSGMPMGVLDLHSFNAWMFRRQDKPTPYEFFIHMITLGVSDCIYADSLPDVIALLHPFATIASSLIATENRQDATEAAQIHEEG